jgi:hypothetical protein
MDFTTLGLKEYLKADDRAYQAYDNLNKNDRAKIHGFHNPVWRDVNGILIREDVIPNLVVNAGVELILTSGLGNCYIGLIISNRVVSDGVINTNTTISSATASFVSGDVGRYITIVGGGVSGNNYVGTIASVTNSTFAIISSNTGASATAQTFCLGPLIANTDTSASHAGWSEISNSNITNTYRPQWNYAVAGRSANGGTTPSTYTLQSGGGTQYIDGFLVASSNSLSNTGDTLISAGEYGGTLPGTAILSPGATLTDVYTVTFN